MTQFLALAGARATGGKRPDAIAPAMAAWSVRDDWAYEGGGAFRLAGAQGWACQIGAMLARRWDDPEAAHALARAANGEPWAGPMPGEPDVLRTHAPHSHYWRWLDDDPAYWRKLAPAAALEGDPLDVPALFIGGWFDIMLEGTFAAYQAFSDHARLVVGPWLHIPWGPRSAGVTGPAFSVDEVQLAFFDWALKGQGHPGPAIRLFDLGSRDWLALERLEAVTPTLWHLASSGLAATTTTDGRLLPKPEADAGDLLVHDPWRPAPVIGGHLGRPAGHADRAAVDERSDVVVYTSAPLDRPMVLRGPVAAELSVDADRPSHDLHCALSLVTGDGAARTLTTGHLTIPDASAPGPRRIAMRHLACTAPAGSAIRLSVQTAAWPAFAVNPGTGARPEHAHAASAEVTTLHIRHGRGTPSTLALPVVN